MPNETSTLPKKLSINGTVYDVPEEKALTLDEAALIERLTYATSERGSTVGAMKALVMIVKRRAGEVVEESALGELRVGDIEEIHADPPPNRAARRAKPGGQA